MAEPLNFNSYYLTLEPTGTRSIDVILSAVARAGKSFHHTEGWHEECSWEEPPFVGDTWNARIQNAGTAAAQIQSDLLSAAKDMLEAIRAEGCSGWVFDEMRSMTAQQAKALRAAIARAEG